MKKFFALLLAAVLMLCVMTACGKKGNTNSDTPNSVVEPEVPPEPLYEPNVLTGLPYAGDYPQSKRFAAVMVNNISGSASQNARPQWGIGEADMLVEIKVEGGITRFMAMYSDYETMPKVGPIRSARDQFFQIILPVQPLYIHIGESVVQTEYKNNYDYQNIDINLDQYGFERDQQRYATGVAVEHTAYGTADLVKDIVDNKGKDDVRVYNSTLFNFVNYNEPERVLTGDQDGNNYEAYKMDIVHSEGYRTYFNYDEASQRYLMSQYSLAKGGIHETIDATTSEQLGFKNVVVLFTDIHVYPGHEAKDLQEVDLTSGGVGYYFCNGRAEKVRWAKGSPQGVLRILDKNGNETDVQINPGKTYLSIVDLDEAVKFGYYPSEAAAEGAGEVVIDKGAIDNTVVDE